jgi:hypothetical protein
MTSLSLHAVHLLGEPITFGSKRHRVIDPDGLSAMHFVQAP